MTFSRDNSICTGMYSNSVGLYHDHHHTEPSRIIGTLLENVPKKPYVNTINNYNCAVTFVIMATTVLNVFLYLLPDLCRSVCFAVKVFWFFS